MTFTAMRSDLDLAKGRESVLFLSSEFGDTVGEGAGDMEVHGSKSFKASAKDQQQSRRVLLIVAQRP